MFNQPISRTFTSPNTICSNFCQCHIISSMKEGCNVYVIISTTQTLICFSEFVIILQFIAPESSCKQIKYTTNTYLRLKNVYFFIFLVMRTIYIRIIHIFYWKHGVELCNFFMSFLLIKGLQGSSFVHLSFV